MRILDVNKFPNELNNIKFDFETACNFIKNQELKREKEIDDKVENEIKFPFFAKIFWTYIFKYNKVPTQQEFLDCYERVCRNFLKKQNFTEKEHKGFVGRLYRTYTSLVRDCLFSLQIKEDLSSNNVKVLYNRVLDVDEGIDILLISEKEKYYALNLFLNSKRANEYKGQKPGRHKDPFENVSYIDLPCPWGGRVKFGEIWMYGITDLNIIRETLEIPIIKRCGSINDNFKGWDNF